MILNQEEKLREENELLREELFQMKNAFLGRCLFAPPEWKLTPQQEALAAALAKRGRMTYHQAALATERPRSEHENVDDGHIRVLIHHIRRKIKPFGLSISTKWGVSFFVDEAYQAAFKERDI